MELSYASKKIKSQKHLNVFKLILISALNLIVVFGLYLLFYYLINPKLNLIYDARTTFISYLIAALFALITMALNVMIYAKKLDKKYKVFYLDLLKNEAMLDGIAMFENKNGLNDVEKEVIEQYVGITNIKLINSFSQTSSSAYFDLYQIKYDIDNKGIIIKTKIDYLDNELIVIRNDGRKGKLSFDDKNLKQYGLGIGQDDDYNGKTFALYATLNNEVYKLINQNILDELKKFATFVKTSLCLTILDDNLLVFIDNWEIELEKSMFNKDGYTIIDAQIEALKRLQSYIESMTLIIKNDVEE